MDFMRQKSSAPSAPLAHFLHKGRAGPIYLDKRAIYKLKYSHNLPLVLTVMQKR